MTDALKTVIQCHSTDAGETWEASLMSGETRIAFVTGLASHKEARDAAEYLQFGLASGWQVMPGFDAGIQSAGAEALKIERASEDSNDNEHIVGVLWFEMITTWCRKMRVAAGLEMGAPGVDALRHERQRQDELESRARKVRRAAGLE
jgi:hypothetical protein